MGGELNAQHWPGCEDKKMGYLCLHATYHLILNWPSSLPVFPFTTFAAEKNAHSVVTAAVAAKKRFDLPLILWVFPPPSPPPPFSQPRLCLEGSSLFGCQVSQRARADTGGVSLKPRLLMRHPARDSAVKKKKKKKRMENTRNCF